MTYSTATKIERLQSRREKLEQELTAIKQQQKTCEAKKKANDRKERNRRAFRLGGLVLLAFETKGKEMSDASLLGALLQVLANATPERIRVCEKYGEALLKSQRKEIRESASAQGYSQKEVQREQEHSERK